jgi:hypothetical protein
MGRILMTAVALSCVAACSTDTGADPEKHIGIFVMPYYDAAATPTGRPMVSLAGPFDELLASSDVRDIIAVGNMIRAEPDRVTPETLMVLAIRLYDLGLRDDAVFWFYVAKDRFTTAMRVLDIDIRGHGMTAFNTLAGPFINGYAFCDIENQRKLRREALDWVEQAPYHALFIPDLPARAGDRRENLRLAIAELRDAVDEEWRYFEDPDHAAEFARIRAENRAAERFCWN